MEKILISACFLGEIVRYDGQSKKLSHQLITKWQTQGRLVSICPEIQGGLPVPRPPAELQGSALGVFTERGVDVSQQFQLGAEKALAICQKYNIRWAILKESSPSCGSELIYDGTFSNTKVAGEGITTSLLRRNGVSVFSEDSIMQLAKHLQC